MALVHGFVLTASKGENERLRNQLQGFYDRPVKNLRKEIKFHITLTLACLPAEKIKLMVKLLEENKDIFKPIKVRFEELVAQADTYLGLVYDSLSLREMHDKLLELIQPLAEGAFNPKYLKRSLSRKQLEYLKKYGYHRIKDFFVPHLTIGRYESKEIRDEELQHAIVPEGEFLFDIFQLDETYDSGYDYEKILWEAKLV